MPDTSPPARPRTVLICHAESRLNREGIARWLASFSDLVGIVLIDETSQPAKTRIRREIARVGLLRFIDVVAFRIFYALTHARRDRQWISRQLDVAAQRYGEVPASVPVLRTPDPSAPAVEEFLRRLSPDVAMARCKRILKASTFTIPAHGTFVLHPGVCPEYRNAHGAFWALARRDLTHVGLTLLKVDKGVDTGPVYGYFTCSFNEVTESHIVIMTRLALDNLDAIRDTLLGVLAGRVRPIDTTGRRSATWGQPWLTSYLRWKRMAKRDAARQKREPSSLPVAR